MDVEVVLVATGWWWFNGSRQNSRKKTKKNIPLARKASWYAHTHTHTHIQSLRCFAFCSLCKTYEQTSEICKFSMDWHAKGEGSDSISRYPELTFTLVLACNAIDLEVSTFTQSPC